MDYDLQRTVLERYRVVCDTVISQEEVMESIVPDAFPDVSRIISASGNGFLTAKQAGEGSARLSGSLSIIVLYVPEGESMPRSLALTLPFQCTGDCPQLKESCQIHASILSVAAEARLMNPRKLLVKAELKLGLKAYGRESREVTCDLSGRTDDTVERLLTEREDYGITAVLEKPFLFSDTLRQSSSKPPMEELLYCHAEQGGLDAKYIGKKLVCKGEVLLSVVYRSGSEVIPARFELPYSQILDLEGGFDEGEPEVEAQLKSADCILKDGELEVAVEMLLQAALWSHQKVTLLSDLYSTSAALDVERGTSRLCTAAEHGVRRESGRQFCESGIPAKQVVVCQASVGPLTAQPGGGVMHYQGDALVQILYLSEDDALCGVEYTVPISCEVELPEGCICVCRCRPVGEALAVPVTGGLEVRLEAEFSWTVTRYEPVPCVTSIRQSAAAAPDAPRPSVIIRMVGQGETLWEIAKSCGSTIGDICTANELSAPTPAPGTVLLIPTRRA